MNITQLRQAVLCTKSQVQQVRLLFAQCPIYLAEGKESSLPEAETPLPGPSSRAAEWSPEIEKSIFFCLAAEPATAACFPVQTKDLVSGTGNAWWPRVYPKIADSVVRFLEEKHTSRMTTMRSAPSGRSDQESAPGTL